MPKHPLTGPLAGEDNLVFIQPEDLVACENLPAEQKAVLGQINQKVAGNETLDGTMDFVADVLQQISPCDRLSLHLLDADRMRMVARWVRARYSPILLDRGYAQDLQGSSLGPIMAQGRLRVIRDLAAYVAAQPGSEATRLLVEEGNRSSLTCPLLVDERPVGILFSSSRRRDAYTMREICILRGIAERLGQAVEKTYRIEQLAAANQAYMEMLGFISHELKAPLGSMLMTLAAVRDGYFGDVTDGQRQQLGGVHRKGLYLMRLIRDYLVLAGIEEGRLAADMRDDVDVLQEVILPAVEDSAAAREERGMDIEQDMDAAVPPCRCDPALLRIVVVNFLGNAAKYGEKGSTIRLSISPQPPGGLRIGVWNKGQGFRPDDRGKLFQRFTRLNDPAFRGIAGTGVGLYTAWRIARLHGGLLDARSEYGQWAEFTLTLPPASEQPAGDGGPR